MTKEENSTRIEDLVQMIKEVKVFIKQNPTRNNEYAKRDMWQMMKETNRRTGLAFYK